MGEGGGGRYKQLSAGGRGLIYHAPRQACAGVAGSDCPVEGHRASVGALELARAMVKHQENRRVLGTLAAMGPDACPDDWRSGPVWRLSGVETHIVTCECGVAILSPPSKADRRSESQAHPSISSELMRAHHNTASLAPFGCIAIPSSTMSLSSLSQSFDLQL